jgi:hypothetical protein
MHMHKTQAFEQMTSGDVEDGASRRAPSPGRVHARTAVSAAVLATVVCVWMAVARHNYGHARISFYAWDFALALVGSLIAAFVPGLDERGERWAQLWDATEGSARHAVLVACPTALVRAALMSLTLASVNATYVHAHIYHNVVEMPVLEVCARFLSDLPQVFAVCLVVELVARWWRARAERP